MRESFVRKSANAFFKGRRAVVLNEILHRDGESIAKGMSVMLMGKNCRNRVYLDVCFRGVIIYGVDPKDLELAKERDNYQPFEGDTIDIWEYELKIKN